MGDHHTFVFYESQESRGSGSAPESGTINPGVRGTTRDDGEIKIDYNYKHYTGATRRGEGSCVPNGTDIALLCASQGHPAS